MCAAQAAQQAAAQRAAQAQLTQVLVQQYADDMLRNTSAWRELSDSQAALQIQTVQLCETIVHKPVMTPGRFDPGGCEAPTVQPGTPPRFTPATPGTWCAPRVRQRAGCGMTARCGPTLGAGRPGEQSTGRRASGPPRWSRSGRPARPRHSRPARRVRIALAPRAASLSHQRMRAGTVIPGACTPASYTKATVVPGWIEKKDCKV